MSLVQSAAQREIERLAAAVDGQFGVAAWPVGSPEQAIGVDPDGLYPTASTFKIPVLYSLYRMVDNGEVNLDDRLPITNDHLTPGSGVLQHLRVGIEPTIYDLAMLMTIVSDNQATDILHAMVGPERIHRDLKELGLTNIRVPMDCRGLLYSMVGMDVNNPEHTYEMFLERGRVGEYDYSGLAFEEDLDSGNDLTSPRDMARLCEYIEQGRGLSEESREGVVDTLCRQQLNNRIPAGLPHGTICAHKTGSLKGVRNDAGIVYAKQPYVIALFSKSLKDERAGEQALVDISAAIWEAFGGEQA
ncbi:MAG TPA: serine hydrolase [Thermomicrobiales bacterium]|nr:serine hydrolase [Thermomicrobiales bacterium]